MGEGFGSLRLQDEYLFIGSITGIWLAGYKNRCLIVFRSAARARVAIELRTIRSTAISTKFFSTPCGHFNQSTARAKNKKNNHQRKIEFATQQWALVVAMRISIRKGLGIDPDLPVIPPTRLAAFTPARQWRFVLFFLIVPRFASCSRSPDRRFGIEWVDAAMIPPVSLAQDASSCQYQRLYPGQGKSSPQFQGRGWAIIREYSLCLRACKDASIRTG